MDEIKLKLDLFVESGMIDLNDREIIVAWLKLISKRELIDFTKLDTFATHSAMVLSREKENQVIESVNLCVFETIEKEIKKEANLIIEQMKVIHEIRDFEEGYVLIHLCNLLSK